MLKQRLIPSLLLKDGRLVKGIGFRDYRDAGKPNTTARVHNAQGADELFLLDISASIEKRAPDTEVISTVAQECFMPLTVGGGIKKLSHAAACLEAGADKICINSVAIDSPELITKLAKRYGSQAVVLAIDVYGDGEKTRVFDHRSNQVTNLIPGDWAARCVDLGVGEIRLMSVEREGKRCGMALKLLEEFKSRFRCPIILEGGAGSLDDLVEAFQNGANGVGVGSMLVFSDYNLVKIKAHLRSHFVEIRG